ncbi:MAG: GNAT family N-acetyltransferase [Acutalibacteraceae bacterium]
MFEKTFYTERLIIREYKKSDIDGFLSVVRQPEIYETTYAIPRNYTRARAEWWFKVIKINAKNKTAFEFGMFEKSTNRYIGNVGLININSMHNRADIAYYIDRAYRNMGYTTEAAEEMLRYGFEELKFKRIGGMCMSINAASRRVMEKIGMQFEGTARCELLKDKIYYDIDHLSILDTDYFTKCKVEK